MIRNTLLWMFVGFLAVYAWRDWYRALCGLVLMIAVVQHPDMPKSMLGIPGLNPWNIGLLSVVMAWAASRRREGLVWDLPAHIAMMVTLYMVVMLVASVRMMVDRTYLDETVSYLVGEHFINVFKWVIPALLLFDGCRSRERLTTAIFSVLLVYVLLAVQVIRWMPLEFAASGDALAIRSQKIIQNEIGYNRVNMSAMLAGASWAMFVSRTMLAGVSVRLAVLAASALVLFGQSLTAGRTGYVTWGVLGLILCLVRWKRYLAFAPIAVLALITLVPGVRDRMLQGFSEDTVDTNSRIDEPSARPTTLGGEGGPDLYTVTSGRTFAWPFVIEKIKHNVVIGYGKLAMRRTGLTKMLLDEYGEGFPHPHNMYLELMLDSGLVGLVSVLPFFAFVVFYSLSLFSDSRSPMFVAIGGVSAALVLATLIAGVGSQTFYPREGAVGMWASIGLMLRMWVERRRAETAARAVTSLGASEPVARLSPVAMVGRPARPARIESRGRFMQTRLPRIEDGTSVRPRLNRDAVRLAPKATIARDSEAPIPNLETYLWRRIA